jgi:hypothetical protein
MTFVSTEGWVLMKKLHLLVLLFLFSLPAELLAQCLSSISLNSSVSGSWTTSCASTHRTDRYAKYYTFTLSSSQQVVISLDSSVDTYLFLLSGSNETGSVIDEDDDISSSDTDSQIVRTLAAGTYTIEATTFAAATTGNFVLSLSAANSGACIKSINTDTNASDSWVSTCSSTHRAGRYAKFFTFSLAASRQVTIDLQSSRDTYVYLLNGSTQTGSVIAENDDISAGDTDSRIVRTLAAGTYTVEATTFEAATTGTFTVRVSTACTDCPFEINAGLNDAWYSTTTNGQGLTVTVYPELKKMFVAWFTFDTERPPSSVTANLGDPGHRWLTAQGPYNKDTATLTIFVTEGGVFDSAQPATTTDPDGDGTMILEFKDCTEGLVSYEIDSLGISGEIPIERIVDDNVALCEALRNN